jgi:hypothetical protein
VRQKGAECLSGRLQPVPGGVTESCCVEVTLIAVDAVEAAPMGGVRTFNQDNGAVGEPARGEQGHDPEQRTQRVGSHEELSTGEGVLAGVFSSQFSRTHSELASRPGHAAA